MAHFAKISENNEVLTVHVINNSDTHNAEGVEDETVGQQYLEKHNNWPAQMWIQTSYNTINNTHKLGGTPFRGNYAGIGYIWDEANNLFYIQKPHASWVLNTTDAQWHSPIGDPPSPPSLTHHYEWNESDQSWDETANLT